MKDELTTGPGEGEPVEPSTVDAGDLEQTEGRPYSGRSQPVEEGDGFEKSGPGESTEGRPYSGR